MRYPNAIFYPGPANKIWYEDNKAEGIILHSMEGDLQPALNMLEAPAIQVSWHFSIARDGTVYQHYGLAASCWHSGSHSNNIRLIGIEHEGKAGQELTEAQFQSSYALCAWIGQQAGWRPSRGVDHYPGASTRNLFEHQEVYQTTCPNGRIPWYRYVPINQEVGVQVRALDQGESIAITNKVFTRFGQEITDNAGETVVEVTSGAGVPVAPGYRAILYVYKDQ